MYCKIRKLPNYTPVMMKMTMLNFLHWIASNFYIFYFHLGLDSAPFEQGFLWSGVALCWLDALPDVKRMALAESHTRYLLCRRSMRHRSNQCTTTAPTQYKKTIHLVSYHSWIWTRQNIAKVGETVSNFHNVSL